MYMKQKVKTITNKKESNRYLDIILQIKSRVN